MDKMEKLADALKLEKKNIIMRNVKSYARGSNIFL